MTDSKTFGDASQVFNGVDVTLNLRQGGLTLQGGTSTGQTTSDFCDVRSNLPELNLALAPDCRRRTSTPAARTATSRADSSRSSAVSRRTSSRRSTRR